MPCLYVPFCFRGLPKDVIQANALVGVMKNAGLEVDRQLMLSATQMRRYQPTMTDSEVFAMYKSLTLSRISAKTVRLMPVIPYRNDTRMDVERSLDFLSERFASTCRDRALRKAILYLERKEDGDRMSTLRSGFRGGRMYGLEAGYVFALPLYSARQTWELQGMLSEFVRCSNAELGEKYRSTRADFEAPFF